MTPNPTTPRYRKLTRLHRGLGQMSQLWLGDDHLLQVQSTGYSESYRRFYFRDIQSVLILHTSRRMYIALALLVPALVIAFTLMITRSGWVGYAIVAGVTVPLLLWNEILGPGCQVMVVTAVKQEKLPSLSRLPKTRRVLRDLQMLIEGAQADLQTSTEEIEPPPVASGPSAPPPLPPPLPS